MALSDDERMLAKKFEEVGGCAGCFRWFLVVTVSMLLIAILAFAGLGLAWRWAWN